MTEKPEALRLAITPGSIVPVDVETTSALCAELRRLHASCEDYAQHKQRQDQRVLELAERVLELKAQRDALLEALKTLLYTADDGPSYDAALVSARAAIKAAEGENHAKNL